MRVNLAEARAFRLADWEITPADGLLRDGERSRRLPPLLMRLLVFLVSRAGEVVSKRDIVPRVWDNEAVSDDSLSASIYQLRKALGDRFDRPRYIETIPKRGYRLIVRPEVRSALQHSGASASGTATIRSLAVLPLRSLSQNSEDAVLADGLTAALITELARLSPLRVLSLTSVLGYAGSAKRAAEIALELQVDAILEGTVVRSGERARIDCRLVDAPRDAHLWVQSYERNLADLLTLQTDVARAVAREIGVRFANDSSPAARGRADFSAEAVTAYLKGRALLEVRRSHNSMHATAYFERALLLEPRFAEAHAALASACIAMIYARQSNVAQWAERARLAAATALEINPRLAHPHVAHALVLAFIDCDFEAAEREFTEAFELQPSLAFARRRYALMLAAMGRSEDAIRELRDAALCDPLNLHAQEEAAEVYFMLRQFDRAISELTAVLAREPSLWFAYMKLGFIHWTRGNMQELHATYHTAARTCGTAELLRVIDDAFASHGAAGLYRAVAKHAEACNPERAFHLPEVIIAYTAAGDRERAMHYLSRAAREHSPYLVWLLASPYVDPLRSDPAFAARFARFPQL